MKYFFSALFAIAFLAFLVLPNVFPKAQAATNWNCPSGTLTFREFQNAKNAGLISGKITIDEGNHLVKADVTNKTGCNLPVTFGDFKMFDQNLFNQEVFDVVKDNSSSQNRTLTIKLPDCMAQIDLWYGDVQLTIGAKHPSVNFGNLLIVHKFYKNQGNGFAGARGDFCGHPTPTPSPTPPPGGLCPPIRTKGEVVADFPNGPHAIVGEQELHEGLDIVVKLNQKADFLQCFSGTSPSEGQHVVLTDWLVTDKDSCDAGYTLVPNAYPNWGYYLNQNANYCIKNTIIPGGV